MNDFLNNLKELLRITPIMDAKNVWQREYIQIIG